MRIVHLAVDSAFQRVIGGEDRVVRLARERAGHAFDPEVAACLAGHATEILSLDTHASVWEETLGCEPHPPLLLEGEAIERGLAAMGHFVDLMSPYLTGHSAGVAELAAAAAGRCRLDDDAVAAVRRAAFVHDLGRVAVHPADLAQARAADRGRMGAGAAASLPVRAGARPRRRSWRRSRRWPARTTSGSTAPATTAGPPARSSPVPHGCSRRPTPSTR